MEFHILCKFVERLVKSLAGECGKDMEIASKSYRALKIFVRGVQFDSSNRLTSKSKRKIQHQNWKKFQPKIEFFN